MSNVICDDTDVFVLLALYFAEESLSVSLIMESTNRSRSSIDIGATVAKHSGIVPQLIAAHAVSTIIIFMNVIGQSDVWNVFTHTSVVLLLLFESLQDSRPMLGAGSSSGVELFQVFMGTRLWQDGADQQVFHGLFIRTFARCLSSLVESPFLHLGICIVQSLSGDDLGLTRWAMSHSNLEVAIPLD